MLGKVSVLLMKTEALSPWVVASIANNSENNSCLFSYFHEVCIMDMTNLAKNTLLMWTVSIWIETLN